MAIDITSVLIPTLCIGGVGLVSAAALAIADKFLSVPEDPRVQKLTECLPGANCGGCGFAGCADYARAIALDGAEINLCAPAGGAGVAAIAAVMGREAGADPERKVALVLCCGDSTEAVRRAHYNGIADCAAAHATAGGDKGCTYGCLGYASCARACPEGGIRMVNGIAVVDRDACITCGHCVSACPRKLIKLVPASAEIHVLCSSKDKGPAVKKVCGTGCIGCRICTKLSGGAIAMDGHLAVVDYTKELKDPELIAKCPGHCIRKV
ncbi:MAG: RnfABCDGE type electron transport complex subunit B [Kiritimatiellaeota bacterium]|nr:RnfABCDGE type electron transport complex subunit B [Kiritimatiellota bacterium]